LTAHSEPQRGVESHWFAANYVWLQDSVTMLIRGHDRPPGIGSGSGGVSSVQGQPVLPEGGGGSCSRVGQRMLSSFGERRETVDG